MQFLGKLKRKAIVPSEFAFRYAYVPAATSDAPAKATIRPEGLFMD